MSEHKEEACIFFDLDGTLFDQPYNKNPISEKNKMAIMLAKNHANVVFSTGRMHSNPKVLKSMHELGITDIIASGGGEIYINNQLFYSENISKIDVLEIVKFANENKISFTINDVNGESYYSHNKFQSWLAKMIMSKRFIKIGLRNHFDITHHKNIIKISLIFTSPIRSLHMFKKLNELYKASLNFTLAANDYVIEITSGSTSKALATKKYLEFKGIKKQNSMHFGDSMSDAVLKGYVGKLIAMGNSSQNFKEVADEIAPHYRKGGIFKYFLQNGFTFGNNEDKLINYETIEIQEEKND
ncbi:Cof-type HAD-IIB family hydrolase [Mycoplasmopsis opalescens]|uniref:Cof-type HAD-IIB family hydrolase n=1 Tax=Mycoplasmopsis opalescens TaxID=114886 RepID=UPI00068F9F11|nr:Cof-type HAD-IIB family hydrolase [Mycoplasmopsis opalescens]